MQANPTEQVIDPQAEAEARAAALALEKINREQRIAREKYSKKIKAAFQIFDPENKGSLPIEEVRYVVHALDMAPTEVQLNEFTENITDDETMEVPYGKLEDALIPKMERSEWERPSEELLFQAFKTIELHMKQKQADDEDAAHAAEESVMEGVDGAENRQRAAQRRKIDASSLTGQINSDQLAEMLTMHGEPFRSTELEDFLKNIPKEDGMVDYSKLAKILASD
ncbi:MAG: hypothetical protein EZS28_012285 [Streblomastix strix]|uniref:EF-hand domain-containing protein n=1 Tax=Streblomastix strix TaxID=222440 RepID=A0A5J4WCX6_9EUKA|nr:MAG: hypothetical protein EZS28_012285 [Streblomastix strix]